jgi:ElaA protein
MLHWVLKEYCDLDIDELYAAMRLRQEIFVVEQNCPYLDADGKDVYSHHLFGFLNKELVAYCRLVNPGISYEEVSIGRVVVKSSHRKYGYGHILMQRALDEIHLLYGNAPVRIGAQSYLLRFYEAHGFIQVGDEYLEDGIPHLIMLRS